MGLRLLPRPRGLERRRVFQARLRPSLRVGVRAAAAAKFAFAERTCLQNLAFAERTCLPACLLACFDTAENEPLEFGIWTVIWAI